MKTRISEAQLRRFYRLMAARMVPFDCGRLCAPANRGVPYCCDQRRVVPILYRDEYRRLRRAGGRFWRPHRPRRRSEEKLAAAMAAFLVMADCGGAGACRRGARALVCRAFPFEPHLDEDGNLLGLTYQYSAAKHCPLVGRPRGAYNPAYIRRSLVFWREALALFPEERELFIEESAKLRRRFARLGRMVQVFR